MNVFLRKISSSLPLCTGVVSRTEVWMISPRVEALCISLYQELSCSSNNLYTSHYYSIIVKYTLASVCYSHEAARGRYVLSRLPLLGLPYFLLPPNTGH